MVNVAEVTPAVVEMVPEPEAAGTAAVVHAASEYKVKLTLPVGTAAPVTEKVAVSERFEMFTPAVPVEGLATVVIVGEALPTAICSFESPHLVLNPLLFESPV